MFEAKEEIEFELFESTRESVRAHESLRPNKK